LWIQQVGIVGFYQSPAVSVAELTSSWKFLARRELASASGWASRMRIRGKKRRLIAPSPVLYNLCRKGWKEMKNEAVEISAVDGVE